MVAYSFKAGFVAPIVARTKQQTIRLPRKRHARRGETIQLYAGMRTRWCSKIIPDPVCVGIDEIRIDLRKPLATFEVNGIPIINGEQDGYASADGFRDWRHMERWWRSTHGPVLFVGVAIRWEDASEIATP